MGNPSVSGPYVTLPHACQGWSHSDGFCQALITDRSNEEGWWVVGWSGGGGGSGGAAVTLESGTVGEGRRRRQLEPASV